MMRIAPPAKELLSGLVRAATPRAGLRQPGFTEASSSSRHPHPSVTLDPRPEHEVLTGKVIDKVFCESGRHQWC